MIFSIFRFLDVNLHILNYRFIKEVTKGVDDDWTVNLINHIRLNDEMEEQKREMSNWMKQVEEKVKEKHKNKKD